jgi:hypothetical protein
VEAAAPKSRAGAQALATVLLVGSLGATLSAQKTDIVVLANGDRITGEVERLERGRLEFSTDDAGTLYLEWDKLVSVIAATRTFDVFRTDGQRLLGSLGKGAPDRSIAVVETAGTTTLATSEVTLIYPIGRSFWKKLDGAIDLGYSYTKSSGVSQLNFNSDTVYRRPGFEGRLSVSLTQTETEDGSNDDDRGDIELSYLRYVGRRWFIGGFGTFERNESLGLELRSQIGGGAGPRIINSNRAQAVVAAGAVVNSEQGTDVETTTNVELLFQFSSSYYVYDTPKTNFDLAFQYYPSLSNFGRQRIQFDSGIRREIIKDFTVSVNVYDTFDSEPPNSEFDRNDVGVVLSVGWTY